MTAHGLVWVNKETDTEELTLQEPSQEKTEPSKIKKKKTDLEFT